LGSFLPLILIIVVFWFLVMRPQRKRQQDLMSKQAALQPGTEVMLGSGIFGRVVDVQDDRISLEVAPGTTIHVAKQAVVRVIEPQQDITPGSVVEDLDKPDDSGPSDRHDQ
jgi:preprotein translocase subunit YajC